ncbi:MAG: secretion system protein E, partial [Archaeoglobus sp.]
MKLRLLRKHADTETEIADEKSTEKTESLEYFRKLAEETANSYDPPEGWLEIDRYPVYDMYVFSSVHIVVKEDENDMAYHVKEPEIGEDEKKTVEELLSKLEYLPVLPEEMKNTDKLEILKSKTDKILDDFRIKLNRDEYYKVFYYVLRDTVLYGKITPLMYDPMLEDISCNGYNKPIFVFHRKFANLKTNITFDSDELDSFVIKLAQQCGKHISIAEPMVDASMPDGSRIQMTLGKEVTDHGSTFTIRKFRKEPITPIHLIKWKTFSSEQMAYLWLCIENRKNLIFAGGTASGKTTSTNAVALFIPKKAKIVTIEDTRELVLPHKNWIPAVTREALQKGAKPIDMYDLLKAALRQRPEYIIVGEVRGREALTLFQAMSTGHTTYSTLHADS